jgi:hypothetical protein
MADGLRLAAGGLRQKRKILTLASSLTLTCFLQFAIILLPTASSLQPPAAGLGDVRMEVEIGAAFYQLGVQLHEMIEESHPQFDKLRAQMPIAPDAVEIVEVGAGGDDSLVLARLFFHEIRRRILVLHWACCS